jgi:hypothetical protein
VLRRTLCVLSERLLAWEVICISGCMFGAPFGKT